jgi:hypothetical protein
MTTEPEGTTLDTILADFFQLDLIAVQNSWGDGAGIFKLKQQLAAYLEAQTRAAIKLPQRFTRAQLMDAITSDDEEYMNGYNRCLDDIADLNRDALTATTLQDWGVHVDRGNGFTHYHGDDCSEVRHG